MRDKRDFRLGRETRSKPPTPKTLMRILEQTEGGERAKEIYRNLTGEEYKEEQEGNEWTK